jgi:hypothetical protein
MNLMGWIGRSAIALVVVGLLFTKALTQTASTGALTGTVSDPTGAVVSDVQVTVTNEVTGELRTVTSQQNGNYVVPLLLPGSYRVEFSRTGFKRSVMTGLNISVTETARLDVQLETGGIQEKVTVTAQAELLQTETSALGRVTNRELVSNLPLVTRNYTQIVTLSPGISAEVTNATAIGRGAAGESQGAFQANGSFARDNNFQMNGVGVNDLQASGFFSGGIPVPNPDAIQEFKVQTGLYDASYGRNAGANVNVVTRSGSNQFHGAAFEFIRNDVLNANDFFRNETHQARGILKQNQFGFTLGGPVKKDKLLFFVSYQGMRQINGVGGGSTSNFFTPPFTSDRSRAALGRLFAGQKGLLGGAAVAPDGSNISSQALALLNLKLPDGQFIIPNPQAIDLTRPLATQGFSAFSVPAKFNEDQFVANVDFLHTAKSKFEGRFFFADSDQNTPLPLTNLGGPPGPGFPQLIHDGFRDFSLTHSYGFGPNLFNQAQFGFARIRVPLVQQEPFRFSDIGVKAPSNANPFPELAINGGVTLGGNGQGLTLTQNHFTYQDSLTYIRGRHTFRLGGGVTRSQLNLIGFHFFGGLFFLSWPDFLLGLPGGPAASGGNGTPFSNVFLSIDIPGLFDRAWRLTDGNAYVQDDIKVTSSFTLNVGVRYERLANLGDNLGRNSGFDMALANPNPPAGGTLQGFLVSKNFPGTVPSGVTQLDNTLGIRGEHENNVGPRIGFAWRLPESALSFTDHMVLRGGYGIYFTRATGQPFIQLIAGPPFGVARQLSAVSNATANFANPFQPEQPLPTFTPYSPTTRLTDSFVDPAYRPPVVQQYSLNLQTDLGHNFLLEVGYVGTRGTHLIVSRDPNQAQLASASNPIRGETTNTLANISKRVPILGFTPAGLVDIESESLSRYNGLDVSLTKRLSNGLQFLAAYTFSHAYSTPGTNTSASGGGASGTQDDRRANYGLSSFDREHRFVISYVYDLPRPTRFSSIINSMLAGWSVAGVTTIQSGLPLTLFGTNANNVFGITSDRAQLAPGCTYGSLTTSGSTISRLNNYFNKGCIARNAAGAPVWPVIGNDGVATAFGTSGVGIVFGPGQDNTDLAIIKRTAVRRLGEGANLEFRSEFFNAFNHPQFANPDTSVTSATFGVISSTAVNPRIIQFALKLNF